MRLTKVVHTAATMMYAPLQELAPELGAEGNGLAFVDADNECHIFVLDQAGAERLRKILSPVMLV